MKSKIKFLFCLLCCIGSMQAAMGNKKDSLMSIVALNKGDTINVNCLNELSLLLSDNDTLQSRSSATKALAMAQKIKFSKGISKAWYNLAYLAEFSFHYPLAEKYYLAGINEAKKSKNLSLEAFGLVDYALTLKKQTKHKEALQINEQALLLYQSLKDTSHIASVYTNLGNNYKNLNQFDKAITAHLNALLIEQKRGNDKGIAKAYNNIGLVYERNNDHESALKNYLLMLDPAKKSGSKKIIATAYGNIGSSYQNLKQSAEAIPFMENALAIHKEEKDLPNVALTLSNLAAAHNGTRQYSKAIANSLDCIDVAKKSADLESEAYSYVNLAKSYRSLENYRAIYPNLQKAEQMLSEINSSAYTMYVYEELGNYYKQTKDFQKALNYQQLLSEIKDTVLNSEKHLQIASLQTQYQTAEKERDLAKSKSQILQNDLLLQKKNNLLLLSAIGLLALAFIAILINRNARLRNTKLMQEKELERVKASQKLQEEKLRISRELHDNIGSQLTFINTSLQQLDPVKADAIQISETQKMAINTIRELRSIVWLINKDEFMIEEMVIKLRDFMKPLQLIKPLVDISIIGNEELKLSAPIASNIFRIIQEASNNTIKYAHANQLSICFDTSEIGKLKLTIKDDGKGFAVDSINQFSFGLKNMNARAKEINAVFELKSSKGEGTEIVLSIPLSD